MVNMEAKPVWTTATLLVVFLVWPYMELKHQRQIDYDWHEYLINSTTGAHIKPSELLEVEKVLGMPNWYINETNSFERLHDLEYTVNLGTALEIDQSYSRERDMAVSGLPMANRTKCAQQLDWIQRQLSGPENYSLIRGELGRELTQLMDSFGKPTTGFFSGATSWPGAYERCLKTSLNKGQIRTRYCWLRMRPKGWPHHEPVRPQARVRMGVCLPESCDTAAFAEQRRPIEWLAKLDLNDFYQQNLEADSMFCLPDERSPIRQMPLSGRVYLVLISGWFSLVLICSVAFEKMKKKKGSYYERRAQMSPVGTAQLGKMKLAFENQSTMRAPSDGRLFRLLEAMSIHGSIKRFKSNPFAESIKSSQQKIRLNLGSLNAIKFMMAVMVVLGHSVYMVIRFTRINSNKIQMGTQTTGLVLMSIGRFVDTFFLLFGLFAAYALLKKVPVDKLATPAVWLGYNLNVLARLMPLIIPLYYYNLLVSVYTSHGPWWDYGLYKWSLKGLCMDDAWWKVIPQLGFLGKYPGVTCLPVNWFLVVYSQLSLIIPVLMFCLCKLTSHFARIALIVYIFCVSSLFMVVKMSCQTTFRDKSFGLYGALLIDLMEKFESLGAMSSIGRSGCIVIGCYVGYLLRMYEMESIRKWPKWFRSRFTLVVVLSLNLLLFMLPLIGSKITQLTQHNTTLNEFIAGFLITGLLWTLLNSLLIVLVVTTYNRTAIVRFLAHPFWHSANKLGLGIFLVHFEIVYSAVLGYEQGPSLGFEADFWRLFAYGLVISFLLAFVLHIFIEAPVNALIGLASRRSSFEKRPVSSEVEVAASS